MAQIRIKTCPECGSDVENLQDKEKVKQLKLRRRVYKNNEDVGRTELTKKDIVHTRTIVEDGAFALEVWSIEYPMVKAER